MKYAPKIGDPNAYGATLRDRNGDTWRIVLGTSLEERYSRAWVENRVGPLVP